MDEHIIALFYMAIESGMPIHVDNEVQHASWAELAYDIARVPCTAWDVQDAIVLEERIAERKQYDTSSIARIALSL